MACLRLSVLYAVAVATQWAAAQRFTPTNQIVLALPTYYQSTNTPDHMEVEATTTITSEGSTITETPTSTVEAPWDVVTATAGGDGYAAGDYVFPLSDSGKEKLGSLFSEIEAACGLPVRRRGEGLLSRQSLTTTECARDFIAGSEVSAWDAGMSTSLITLTAGDVAVGVEGLSAAALVVLSAWIIGKGVAPTDTSPTFSNAAVTDLNEDLVDVDTEEPEEEPPLEVIPSAGHSFFVASDDQDSSASQSILDWQRTQPWSIRLRSHALPLADGICQEAPFSAPIAIAEADKVDVTRSVIDFCKEKAGQELTDDTPSQYKRYDLEDHSFWVIASIWDEPTSPFCDYKFIDSAECSHIGSNAFIGCTNDEGTETTGGEAYGECVKYTVTIDPSMTNTEPPSWDDANGGEIAPIADEIVNHCLDSSSVLETGNTVTKFTYAQAEAAIADFCGHPEDQLSLPDAAQPVWKSYPGDGATVQLVMQWAQSGQDACHKPQSFSSQVTQADCSKQFMAAVNNCNTNTITEKYGNKPLTWNSANGCIDFIVYGDAEDWSCDHLGVMELQCSGKGVQLD